MLRYLLIMGAMLVPVSSVLAEDDPPVIEESDSDLALIFKDGNVPTGMVEQAMRHEVENLLQGIHIEWVSMERASSMTFNSVVIVEFSAKPVKNSESGKLNSEATFALGETQMVDGVVIPFVTIYPNRVKDVAMVNLRWAGDRTDEYLGRSLGRVLAHELYHALSRSMTHSKKGVMKPILTGQELVSSPMKFGDDQIQLLRARLLPPTPVEALSPQPQVASSFESQTSTAALQTPVDTK